MAQIINLNKARKQKSRTDSQKRAAENRVRFGRSKAEKQRAKTEAADAKRKLDQHQLDTPDDSGC